MGARPPYTTLHTGPVLLCGPAPTLYDDFAAARTAYPDAALMALSWAIRAVRAAHVFSQHYEKAATFRALGEADHPGHKFLIHSQPDRSGGRWPQVDHSWACAWDVANSAVAACLVLREMGFTEIVLCGVALDGTAGYAFPIPGVCFWTPAQCDVGHAGKLVENDFHYRAYEFAGQVFAMSGAPRKLFGLPPRLRGNPT